MKTQKAKPETNAASVTEETRAVTLEEVNIAIDNITNEMKATPEDMANRNYVDAVKMWTYNVQRTEAAIAAGGHNPDELSILNQRLREARASIQRLSADIEVLPLLQRLDVERTRLESVAARRAAYGTIGTGPVYIALPESFGPSIEGFTLPEDAPPKLSALFMGAKNYMGKIAVEVETAFAELSAAAAKVAALDEPVTDEALAAVRRKRRALAMSLKLYLLTAASVLEELVYTDTAAIVSAHNSALDAEAERIAADIEAKAVEAGITPDLERQGAGDNPEVSAVLARKVAVESVQTFEYGFIEVLCLKAGSARKILEAELSALV